MASNIQLLSLHVAKNGDILFRGTRELRTLFASTEEGYRATSSHKVKFDLLEQRPGQFRAVPDERFESHSLQLAHRLLEAYIRAAMTEKVFPNEGDLTRWYVTMHRLPTMRDLVALLKSRRIIPNEVGLPFLHSEMPLFSELPAVEAEQQLFAVEKAPARRVFKDASGKLRVTTPATFDKMQKLTEQFRRPAAKS